ncbi:MAG: DUF512 domain-containing protein [Clostridia bacterium]|nr:DUF512 domain-containing protein [Clostridia bacterium]
MKNKAVVKLVDPDSIASDCGIEPGDAILRVNGNELKDILDFKYYTSDDYYVVEVEKKNGTVEEIEIYNDYYEQFGVVFENQLIDTPRECRNKCIFCFMDQLPPNVRDTMHFKDDDVRLSFLAGNYVTLTNLNDDDIDRLCRLKVSPINVSVHVTDPERRCMMLHNRFAGRVLDIMKKFADSGIIMNAQIVLCKGINDGEYLKKTVYDLKAMYPAVRSVSIVPVGLSKYRDGLFELEGFDKDSSLEVINQVTGYQKEFAGDIGTSLVYLADEFYIQAQVPIPPYEHYEDFPQIENGVGLVAVLDREIANELEFADEFKDKIPAKKSIATSYIAYDFICGYVDKIKSINPNLDCNVYRIKNDFFGEKITVTGLLCGRDIINQLKGKSLGEYLILSESMFKDDCDIFLDDTTLGEVEAALGVKIIKTDNSGMDFVNSLMQ